MKSDIAALLVEDDVEMADIVQQLLSEMGFSVRHETDGRAGLEAGLLESYDLIVLDIRLPSIDGLEICKRIRKARADQPILMLTAETDELSTVLGLELGADAYIAKPFRAREFKARIGTLLRRMEVLGQAVVPCAVQTEPTPGTSVRSEPPAESTTLRSGLLELSEPLQAAYFDSQKIPLTPTEYRLLLVLLTSRNRLFSPDQLAQLVSGYESNIDSGAALRTHISRLRRKLVSAGVSQDCLRNEPGFGYRFVDSDD